MKWKDDRKQAGQTAAAQLLSSSAKLLLSWLRESENLRCWFFRIELVENIPDHLSFHADSRPHLPLSAGFHALLDKARYSVEVVSPVWDLNAWDVEAKQV